MLPPCQILHFPVHPHRLYAIAKMSRHLKLVFASQEGLLSLLSGGFSSAFVSFVEEQAAIEVLSLWVSAFLMGNFDAAQIVRWVF